MSWAPHSSPKRGCSQPRPCRGSWHRAPQQQPLLPRGSPGLISLLLPHPRLPCHSRITAPKVRARLGAWPKFDGQMTFVSRGEVATPTADPGVEHAVGIFPFLSALLSAHSFCWHFWFFFFKYQPVSKPNTEAFPPLFKSHPRVQKAEIWQGN